MESSGRSRKQKKTKKKETTSHWTAAASNQMARPFFIGSFRNGPSLCSSATSMPPIANVRTYRVFTEFFFPWKVGQRCRHGHRWRPLFHRCLIRFFFGHRIDGWFRFDCRPFLSIDPNPGMTSSWLDFDRFSIVPSFTEFLWSDPLLHFYLKVSFQYWRWWFHFDCRSLFLIAPCLEWISNRFSLDSFKALPSFTELTLEPYSSSRLLIWFRLPIVPLSHSESRDDIKLTAYWCYRVFFLWPDLIDLGLCVVSSTLSI